MATIITVSALEGGEQILHVNELAKEQSSWQILSDIKLPENYFDLTVDDTNLSKIVCCRSNQKKLLYVAQIVADKQTACVVLKTLVLNEELDQNGRLNYKLLHLLENRNLLKIEDNNHHDRYTIQLVKGHEGMFLLFTQDRSKKNVLLILHEIAHPCRWNEVNLPVLFREKKVLMTPEGLLFSAPRTLHNHDPTSYHYMLDLHDYKKVKLHEKYMAPYHILINGTNTKLAINTCKASHTALPTSIELRVTGDGYYNTICKKKKKEMNNITTKNAELEIDQTYKFVADVKDLTFSVLATSLEKKHEFITIEPSATKEIELTVRDETSLYSKPNIYYFDVGTNPIKAYRNGKNVYIVSQEVEIKRFYHVNVDDKVSHEHHKNSHGAIKLKSELITFMTNFNQASDFLSKGKCIQITHKDDDVYFLMREKNQADYNVYQLWRFVQAGNIIKSFKMIAELTSEDSDVFAYIMLDHGDPFHKKSEPTACIGLVFLAEKKRYFFTCTHGKDEEGKCLLSNMPIGIVFSGRGAHELQLFETYYGRSRKQMQNIPAIEFFKTICFCV